jgi:hypothetical protein
MRMPTQGRKGDDDWDDEFNEKPDAAATEEAPVRSPAAA